MNHYYTLRNILTRHAPERISQIEKKHILNIHYYIHDTLIDDDGYFAFDTAESLCEFIDEKLADIRETIKFHKDHQYSVELTYDHIDVLILDEDPDLDLFSAEFPCNPGKTAYFECGDLGVRGCTAITYDNYEWSDNDRLV